MSPDNSLTIQTLEFEKEELTLEVQNLREKAQGLLNAQHEWEAERQCLQQAMSQWKQTAETLQARFDTASQKVVPAMETLRLCLSELFDTRVSGQC
jgi:transcription initiation factor TFIID subunit TAF12